MSRPHIPQLLCIGLALMLSACAAGSGGGTATSVEPNGVVLLGTNDLATQQACRQRVNEMYEVRDRGDIYAANPSNNSPFSANSNVGVPSRGLSGQFAYGQSLADCERNATNGARPPGAPAPAATSR